MATKKVTVVKEYTERGVATWCVYVDGSYRNLHLSEELAIAEANVIAEALKFKKPAPVTVKEIIVETPDENETESNK